MRARTLMSVVGLSVGLVASSASAQVARNLIQEDKPLPGGDENALVSSINGAQLNGVGGYIFGVNTDDGVSTLSHFVGAVFGGAPGVLRTEATIGDLTQTSFEGFYGFADSGSIGYSPSSDRAGGSTGLDGAWMDDTAVAVEEDALLNGFFVSFGSRPTMTNSGQLWWVGGETDTQGGSTDVRALYAGSADTPVIREGDMVVGLADPVDGIDFDYDVSASGTNWINAIDTATGSSNDTSVVINGAVAMSGGAPISEGNAVPMSAGGMAGENWDNFDFFSISESGDWYATGDTDGATATDEFIMRNGEIILREGDSINVISGGTATINGSIADMAGNESGDYVAEWDIDTMAGNVEALILNGEVLIAEGDLVDWNGDGVIDAGDNNGVISGFTGLAANVEISERRPDGSFDVYFTADIDFNGTSSTSDDLEGGFIITIPAPGAVFAFGLAGLAGVRRRR